MKYAVHFTGTVVRITGKLYSTWLLEDDPVYKPAEYATVEMGCVMMTDCMHLVVEIEE